MTTLQVLKLNDIVIESRESDNFINATQLCKAGKKQFKHWYSLDSTKELIKELENNLNVGSLNFKKLVETKKGRYNSGSWIHPDLAVQLAQWISPVFVIQVSQWIREWRSYSEENENKYQEALNNLKPSYNSLREKEIQTKLREELNAEIEVKTPVGSIDLLTDHAVIEIKEYGKWKHAIGQVLCYGLYYKNRQKKIILFGSGDIDKLIQQSCEKLEIELEILE